MYEKPVTELKVNILHRGIIPRILKRGPLHGVTLGLGEIRDLMILGCPIQDAETGRYLTLVEVTNMIIVAQRDVAAAAAAEIPSGFAELVDEDGHEMNVTKEIIEPGNEVPAHEIEGEHAPLAIEPSEDTPETTATSEVPDEDSQESGEPEEGADVESETADEGENPATTPDDPYAGLSKNQRKKLRREQAAAAANAGTAPEAKEDPTT